MCSRSLSEAASCRTPFFGADHAARKDECFSAVEKLKSTSPATLGSVGGKGSLRISRR